jgi:glycosyltransferase involved in cell wall biosynthesis
MDRHQLPAQPLVSVICTCYNQASYLNAALDSVVQQVYPSMELHIIDNGSTDVSRKFILAWQQKNAGKLPIRCQFQDSPINYCQSFNRALAQSRGDLVLDLAADDFLHPRHVAEAVKRLKETKASVYFCNVLHLYPDGRTRAFYPVDASGKAIGPVPQGDVFASVVERYRISSASLVLNASVLKAAGGYDETLVYEDFDLLVRMARDQAFVYGDLLGVTKRVLPDSFSRQQYRAGETRFLSSTLRVCDKIASMLRTEEEVQALKFRLIHETKHALASGNFASAAGFLKRYPNRRLGDWRYYFYKGWLASGWDFSRLYAWWRRRRDL